MPGPLLTPEGATPAPEPFSGPSPLPAPLPAPALPPAVDPPTTPGRYLTVGAREFSYTLSRPVLATGEVTFELRNGGEDPHNMVVSPAGTHGPLATFSDVAPGGGMATRRLLLERGSYYLWCAIEFHEAAGMSATLRVE